MKELTRRYLDFISEYDPYYQEEPELGLEEMLYNLECIRDLNDLEPDELVIINKLIEDFKAYKSAMVKED